LAAIVVVGAVISVVTLGRASFSLDESLSVSLAYSPWHVFTQSVLHREANMVFYYLVLRGWDAAGSGIFGSVAGSETIARSLSVVSVVGALAVVMVLSRRLFDQRTALVCGVLLAVDPLVVLFAQDARGYGLSLLLVSGASALFVRGIRSSTATVNATTSASAPSPPQWAGWSMWVGYAVLSALAAYCNFWAALVPLAHATSLAFLPPGTAPWRRLVPTAVGLAVLLAPLALLIHATDSSGVNWAAGSSAGKVFTTARADVPHAVIDAAVLAVVVVLVLAGVALRRHRRAAGLAAALAAQWPVVFALCWLIVPVAAVVLLSLVYKPLLVVRYLVICLPPFMMLVAYGLARLRGVTAVALAAVLVVLSGVGVGVFIRHGSSQDWRGAVAQVSAQAEPGDGLIDFAPYTRIPFQWYVVKGGGPRPQGARADLRPIFPSGSFATEAMHYDASFTLSRSGIEKEVAGYHRVWVVLSQQELYPAEDRALQAGLRSAGLEPVRTEAFHGVDVVLYGSGS
jgi:mannosyltransferase